jgi:uncharacterized protein (TIGR03437 family)
MKLSAVLVPAVALAGMLRADATGAVAISYAIQTVAGSSAVGDGGPATEAPLSDAEGVAIDAAGNIFIADANDHRVRKVAADGTISTVAGDGTPGFRGDGGPASGSRLNTPYGVALDRAGNLYIADLGNNRVRKVGPDGIISTVSGTETLLAPRNVALDATGTLYISEFGGHRVRRLGADGIVVVVAGKGAPGFAGDGGPATLAQLSYPAGLAFDAAGNLYIADSGNNCICKVSGGTITTVLGVDSSGNNLLYLPTGVAADGAGNLYIADQGFHSIHELSAAGVVSALPGAGRDLALDRAGDLYIASGPQLLELTPTEALTTIAGDGSYEFRGDGAAAAAARLFTPVAVALGSGGTLYIADRDNLRIRVVNAAGVISTLAGDGSSGPAPTQLSFPAGVAVDASGTVYISDQDNDRIQKITAAGTISTVIGTGTPGFNGDGLPAISTQVFSPGALALASDGTLYFVDTANKRVRKLSKGIVSTVMQAAARGLAVDGSGRVCTSDVSVHSVLCSDAAGNVTVIAGTGAPGFGGDGAQAAAAQLNAPGGLAFDSQGNLYIADTGNNRIRVIGADGTIHTIAGTGAADFDGDGGPALSATLNAPVGLAVDASGNIWIADSGNNRLRKLTPDGVVSSVTQPPAVVSSASMLAGPVAPGEIVTIFGTGIGPVTAAGATLDASGRLETKVADTQVMFDGVASPLFYVQDSQINAQAPYEIAGKTSVDVEVFYQGELRGKVTVPVAASAPGIFAVSAGKGLAAALNEDGSLNSTFSAAPRGSVVTLYGTGEGVTQPAATDGQPAAAPFPSPVMPVTLSIGGYPVEILFAGSAPGFAGLLQINARVPAALLTTGTLPVVLRIGTASSQDGVTIAVR